MCVATRGGAQFSLITLSERLVNNADRAGQAWVIRLRRNPAAFLVGDPCGTPPSVRMCACQKRGEPDLKQMKCKLNRARRETAEIRSTGPALHPSKLVRTWAATRYSCGVDRAVPRGDFLFSLSTWPYSRGGNGVHWKRRRLSREILSRVTARVERKGKRFASFVPFSGWGEERGRRRMSYRCNERGRDERRRDEGESWQKFRSSLIPCVSSNTLKRSVVILLICWWFER